MSAQVGGWSDDEDRTIINTARKFRAEFQKAIDDFNEAQERRIEADQIAALTSFIAQRDTMVQAYKDELMAVLNPESRPGVDKQVLQYRDVIRSANTDPITGEGCGIPNSISCSITYSRFNTNRTSTDGIDHIGITQILDGAAIMAGNHQNARHTPTVIWTTDGKEHNISGKSVCADCYLYVNADVSFAAGDVVHEIGVPEGIVVCSEAGKFVNTRASSHYPD